MKKILKASAGTGKTYRLSLEYVAALLKGEDFEEIVVMTFTRKATAEIRERIFEHIEDILKNDKNSDVYKSLELIYPDITLDNDLLYEKYEKMIINKDKINIYTIDSFINLIFKKAIAPYIGIYDYEIIEDNKNDEIVEMVFKRILDNKSDFEQLERFLSSTVDRRIDKYISLIKGMIAERWKFLLLDDKRRKKIDYKDPAVSLDESIYYLEEIAGEKNKEFEKLLIKDYKDIIIDYKNLTSSDLKIDMIMKNKNLFIKKSYWHGNKVKGKKVADLKSAMEESFELFRENLAAYIFNEEMIPYESDIFNFYKRVFEIYDEIKFREKKFTHLDISNYCYKYFRNEDLSLVNNSKNDLKEYVSEYFYEIIGSKVKNLFIDEFQDTSILQWKILLPLIRNTENLITVGDEKQSIYGWRGGEKELFANLDKIIGGKSESLSTCYRSQEEILNFVNDFFLSLEKDWDYSRVDHLPEKNEGYVEILLGGNKCKKNTDTKTFEKMSEERQEKFIEMNESIVSNLKEEIAEKIKNELDNKGDIGILARTSNDLNEIAYELDKKDIPYIHESKNSLLEHEAIKGIYFLLLYLNYGDYFNLLRFMRSDIIGIDSNELKLLLKNSSSFEDYLKDLQKELREILYDKTTLFSAENIINDYFCLEEVAESKEGEKKHLYNIFTEFNLQDYLNDNNYNYNKININYLEKLFEIVTILNELDYDLLDNKIIKIFAITEVYKENSGATKNIYRFFSLMKNFSSLVEFIEYIEENKDSDELKESEIKKENAVKLMTIHKAKGLSFATEFFYWAPGGNKGGYSADLKLYIEFDNNFENVVDYLLTNSRYKKYFDYLGFDFAKKEEKRELMEEINNVYVALTRPKENLFFYIEGPRGLKVNPDKLCWASNDNYGFYENAILNASDVGYLAELINSKKFGKLNIDSSLEDEDLSEKENYSDDKEREKIENLEGLKRYFKVVNPSQDELNSLNIAKNFEQGVKVEQSKTIGQAIHYYLEHIEYAKEAELEYAKKMAQGRFGNILGPEKIKKVMETAENFIEENPKYFSERWKVFNEYELQMNKQKYRIDRLLVDKNENKILIVDFKTGITKEKEQLKKYKKAISKKLEDNQMNDFDIETEFVDIHS